MTGKGLAGRLCLAAGLALMSTPMFGAATLVINNINAAGVGFNDPTPAAHIGGNTGNTLGEQRLIAFTYAANLWGATLTSTVPIIINAQFSALTCTATAAVLGSAGATNIFGNFLNAPKTDTWYSYALANKISGAYQGTLNAPQINANFNANLGNAGCLTGTFFYLGLDGNHGTNVDFVATLLHEMAHGLGFQTFTSGSTGNFNSGFPSIWDHFLMDNVSNLLWKDMTPAQRVASAINTGHLVWTGAGVTNAAPTVLTLGQPRVVVTTPAAVANSYLAGAADFGPALFSPGVTGNVMPVVDQANGTGLACNPLTGPNLAVAGKIALIDRGTCGFSIKVKNAQNAGAIAVLIADSAAGSPPTALGGTDLTITIPSVRITQADGILLKAALATRSRGASAVTARIGLDATLGYQGLDSAGRMKMFAPNPFQSGSSVSHYDTVAKRNQLMEPSISGDLTQSLIPPQDLTFRLLQDIGW